MVLLQLLLLLKQLLLQLLFGGAIGPLLFGPLSSRLDCSWHRVPLLRLLLAVVNVVAAVNFAVVDIAASFAAVGPLLLGPLLSSELDCTCGCCRCHRILL